MQLRDFFLIGVFLVMDAQSYRLPTSLIPEQYTLDIISYVGEENNFDFEGKVTIQVNCIKETTNITLHSKDLEIDEKSVQVTDLISKEVSPLIKVNSIEFDKENEFLVLNLWEPLTEEHMYNISIKFKGKLNDGLAGFYRSSYVDAKTKQKRWLGVTQFEATSARRAFPCFDEPAMKARFEINIGRKLGYSSISNMPLDKTVPMVEKVEYYWDKYENSVPMSTYLVAFIVSDFGYKTAEATENNNVTFNIWARKDALNQVEFAKKVGPKCLDYYEKYFGIKYPLPKQDMVAIPDFSAGAMENWGLITYRESYLLYDPEVSSTTSQHSVASVIAHELAHQWFGNLVTMKWWTDLWLNEGFATYMAGLAVEQLFPKWNSLQEETVNNVLSVFSFDALKTSHPVSVPIGHPDEIDEIFDTISYKKGSFLIRMMGNFLGEETLRKGVSGYLVKHKYGNAEQDDLWESLTEEAHKFNILPENVTVKEIMDSWTVQTGYPVITVERNYTKKSAQVSQERFLRDSMRTKDDIQSLWWVPLTYTSKSEHNFNITTPKTWMSSSMISQEIKNVADENDWLIFNIQTAGLYKVNYDLENWGLISKQLQTEEFKNIPTLNRVQLIDDAADLAWVNKLKYDVLIDLLQYLKYEDEYLPWKSALSNIAVLKRQLRLTPAFGNFKSYLKKLLTPIYKKLGGLKLQKVKADKLDLVKHQVLIASWGCRYGIENCTSEAVKLFDEWRTNPDKPNPIPKDLRSVVYCTSLRNGGEEHWDFLWRRYQKSNVATEKNVILSALGCVKEPWILKRYLQWSLDDNRIRRQDCSTVFSSVASNDVGFYIAKTWFYENFRTLHEHLAPNSRRISRFLSSLSGQMVTQRTYEEFKDFVEDNGKLLAEIKQGVQQSLETIKLNVQWQKEHQQEVAEIFEKHADKKDVEVVLN